MHFLGVELMHCLSFSKHNNVHEIRKISKVQFSHCYFILFCRCCNSFIIFHIQEIGGEYPLVLNPTEVKFVLLLPKNL